MKTSNESNCLILPLDSTPDAGRKIQGSLLPGSSNPSTSHSDNSSCPEIVIIDTQPTQSNKKQIQGQSSRTPESCTTSVIHARARSPGKQSIRTFDLV